MTPTGTNLLGLVKHLAGVEYVYLGDSLGRPAPETMSWNETARYGRHADGPRPTSPAATSSRCTDGLAHMATGPSRSRLDSHVGATGPKNGETTLGVSWFAWWPRRRTTPAMQTSCRRSTARPAAYFPTMSTGLNTSPTCRTLPTLSCQTGRSPSQISSTVSAIRRWFAGRAHLMDLVGTVGEPGPPGMLIHAGQRSVGGCRCSCTWIERSIRPTCSQRGAWPSPPT